MAKQYSNSLAGVTAQYPGSVYTPVEFKNYDTSYSPIVNETFLVPSGNYTMRLNFGILKQTDLTVTQVTGGPNVLQPVPWGQVPGAGEVAVNFDLGLLEFDSSLEGDSIEVDYTPFGSPLAADYENQIQKEIAATQTAVNGITGTTASNFTIDSDGNTASASMELRFGGTGTENLKWNHTTGSFQFSDDLVVDGNLTVSGTTTTVNSETVTIDDNIIVLNNNVTAGTPTENGGLQVRRGGSTSASILWDETSDVWRVGLAGSESLVLTNTAVSGSALTGTTASTFIIDSNGDANTANMSLDFGGSNVRSLTWDFANDRFEFQESILVNGEVTATSVVNTERIASFSTLRLQSDDGFIGYGGISTETFAHEFYGSVNFDSTVSAMSISSPSDLMLISTSGYMGYGSASTASYAHEFFGAMYCDNNISCGGNINADAGSVMAGVGVFNQVLSDTQLAIDSNDERIGYGGSNVGDSPHEFYGIVQFFDGVRSSDGSDGITQTVTINDAVLTTTDHILVFKNGLLTSYTAAT
jgi:hypothetical protein